MRYPTVLPNGSPRSLATRLARVMAARRRGCATTILAFGSESRRNWGTRDDLPHPVSPRSTATSWNCTAVTIASLWLSIGSTVPWLSDAAPHGSSSTAAGAVLLVRRPKRCETSSALAPSASCTAGPRASCARTETGGLTGLMAAMRSLPASELPACSPIWGNAAAPAGADTRLAPLASETDLDCHAGFLAAAGCTGAGAGALP
mmetsp:Transcript_99957/g.285731  ORF Transcript_99957/g.285731 Transcript_99957/m.285731 type:complete len:204 (-) Transcript_99957:73-684(-)